MILENFLQVLVAFVWISGLHRFAGPLPPALRADLIGYSLVLPFFIGVARFFGLPSSSGFTQIADIERWSSFLFSEGSRVGFALSSLFVGTAFIFVFQELIPVLQDRLPRTMELRRQDSRLSSLLEEVEAQFQRIGFERFGGRPLKIFRLETQEGIAALQGLVEPTLLISDGILAKLEEEELKAAIAHEYAHYYYGGNLRFLGVWIMRAFQAFNPAALIAFRTLTEHRELACDALAVTVTGKPATLAAALLKVYDSGRATQNKLIRHAEGVTTKIRVRTLLDPAPDRLGSRPLKWFGVLVMGVILWSIG